MALFRGRHVRGVDEGKLAGLVLAGLFFAVAVVFICLPFHTSLVNTNYDERSLTCHPAILSGWAGANDCENAKQYACGGPARERLIFGGGTALLVAVTVATAVLLPRGRTHQINR